MVTLYAVAINLVSLLFTIINKAYPQVQNYYYSYSFSISFPVSLLIIVFPIFILLSWLLEKGYEAHPEKREYGLKKWLSYLTLFVSGLIVVGDFVTILYYFIDGREMTTAFLLKALSLFVVSIAVFGYYISDIRNKLTSRTRKIWAYSVGLVLILVIVLGFSIIGSPRAQQLLRYDEQKVSDIQTIRYQVENYYYKTNTLPQSLTDLTQDNNYFTLPLDKQNNTSYGYNKTGNYTYELCATFNKPSQNGNNGYSYPSGYMQHPAGEYCFKQSVNPTIPQIKQPL